MWENTAEALLSVFSSNTNSTFLPTTTQLFFNFHLNYWVGRSIAEMILLLIDQWSSALLPPHCHGNMRKHHREDWIAEKKVYEKRFMKINAIQSFNVSFSLPSSMLRNISPSTIAELTLVGTLSYSADAPWDLSWILTLLTLLLFLLLPERPVVDSYSWQTCGGHHLLFWWRRPVVTPTPLMASL